MEILGLFTTEMREGFAQKYAKVCKK